MSLPKIAVSVGDINGIGLELVLKSHAQVSQICQPIYCVDEALLHKAATLLGIHMPQNIYTHSPATAIPDIEAGKVTHASGRYSFDSFHTAIKMCQNSEAEALVTMPIHKEAWMLAGLSYKGHTDYLRKHFDKEAIMMLGCEEMYVALFTEHIPLKEVALHVNHTELSHFLKELHAALPLQKKIAVLGLNPHAGDNGVLGDEEFVITKVLQELNTELGCERFVGPVVPDIAFTPSFRKNFRYFVAMYHDQGLAPLKALYFEESINISLNLPIIRTSVDHGTAFDIAYRGVANNTSYLNAIKAALNFADK